MQVPANILLQSLSNLPDPRNNKNIKHELNEVMVIAICAIAFGAESFQDIARFVDIKFDWFKKFLKLENGVPSHDTFNRIFRILDKESLADFFINWTSQISSLTKGEVVAFLASHGNKSPQELIAQLGRLEAMEKKSRSIKRRLAEARLGRFSKMDCFDWSWPKEIHRQKIEEILKLDFLGDRKNIFFMGPEGIGKTMLAKNIAWTAVSRGYRALFTTASKLASDLIHSGHKTQVAIKKYVSPDILVIDELGYLSFEQKAANALFEVISQRYESKSIVLTTNLSFADWPAIFPGAACVIALVDRLTHRADIIRIEADSYRKKQSRTNPRGKKPRKETTGIEELEKIF